MAPLSIVRVGPSDDNQSSQLLRNAIVSFFQQKDVGSSRNDTNENGNTDSDSRFMIRNKYFSADIMLKDIDAEEDEGEIDATAATMEDGVILVFDAVQSNPDRCLDKSKAGSTATFDSLHAAHQKAISNNTCGDLLRICVGVSLSELSPSELRGKEHEKEYSRRILWCLDNGYEYVEADLSEAGQRKGHDDRDKDGFSRIIEAIEGTVWSSAEMSKSKSNLLKNAFADSKTTMQHKVDTDNIKGEGEEENPYVPPDPSLLTSISFSKTTEEKDTTKSDNEKVAAMFGLKEESPALDHEDQETEKLFNQMENVLKEASQIRQASKSGVLSDEERRERAGTAALALVNLMGQFGLEEDDDDSYGSDDSILE
eukprot:jgi/Psemu1/289246/fgenesh1_pg.337_\